MSQSARVEKLEEITFVVPPRQPLPAKPPIGAYWAPKANFLVWYAPILKFLIKTISFHPV
jgi:hypothetical protein